MPAEEGPDDYALVHRLLADYVARRDGGETPSLAEYEGRLQDARQRRRLRELVQALAEVDDALPVVLTPDTLIDSRYLVVRELGKGGMGRVMLARDQKNDRDVALK